MIVEHRLNKLEVAPQSRHQLAYVKLLTGVVELSTGPGNSLIHKANDGLEIAPIWAGGPASPGRIYEMSSSGLRVHARERG
jgi:hypothetical protein